MQTLSATPNLMKVRLGDGSMRSCFKFKELSQRYRVLNCQPQCLQDSLLSPHPDKPSYPVSLSLQWKNPLSPIPKSFVP